MEKMMFNDRYCLTKAVLEGRKTMTRRVMKNQSNNLVGCIGYTKKGGDLVHARADFDNGVSEDARYAIGEIVAVAQSYETVFYDEHGALPTDTDPQCNGAGFKNKMFVKAEYMPHQIRITGVRAERLQDISDEECMKEGVLQTYTWDSHDLDGCSIKRHLYGFVGCGNIGTPRVAFASLIDKVSGKGTWKSNPWVWVYEFELVK